MTQPITRRTFISASAVAPMAIAVASNAPAHPVEANPGKGAWVRWLDGGASAVAQGVTWGTPWPRGAQKGGAYNFGLRDSDQKIHVLQSWPLAYWPDGSLKFTAHALPPNYHVGNGPFEVVVPRSAPKDIAALTVLQDGDSVEVDTGVFRCRFARSGSHVISSIERDGREALRNGKLVLLRQDAAGGSDAGGFTQQLFESLVSKVTVEQHGPLRAVVKVEGSHSRADRAWLPFTLRFYFYVGGDALRVLHTIVFDGDENQDFIRGIGLRFTCAQDAELYDRHVRFSGDDDGLFGEAVRGLTGLRRDPGKAARDAQVEGNAATDISATVKNLLRYIPAFGDWTLFQPNADGFTIRKRTADGHAWLDSGHGKRAGGLGYVGSPKVALPSASAISGRVIRRNSIYAARTAMRPR